jgi:phosphoribosyl 1,2-cyclic phosphodiesterase
MQNFINIGSSSSGNCFVIQDGSQKIVLDMGFTYKDFQKRYQKQAGKYAGALDFTFLLITHRHGDHFKGAEEFSQNGGLVYVPESLGKGFFRSAIPGKSNIVNGVYFIPFEVIHHDLGKNMRPGEVKEFYEKTVKIDCLGYLVVFQETGNIWVYVTDTAFVMPPLEHATHCVLECNHDLEIIDLEAPELHIQRAIESHLSVQDVCNILKSSNTKKLRKLFLMHNSESNLDKKKAKKMIREHYKGEIIFCKKNGGFDAI